MRFDSCHLDTCPPASSQTAQGVNKPKKVSTRRREGGDQLEKTYCQQSPRMMLSYCIPPFLPSSNRKCFQKRWESLKWLLTAQSSCPPDVGFNGLAVHGMGNPMLQILTISAHAPNTTLAGTEARRESDSVKNKLNSPNLRGLIQLLKICLYPVKAITSDTISCKEGKSAISGLTEQRWLLDCSSVCSADWKEKSQGSRKEIHTLKIKRVKMLWTTWSLFCFKHSLKTAFLSPWNQ